MLVPICRRMIPQPAKSFERRFPNDLDSLHGVTQEMTQFLESGGVGVRAVNLAQLVVEEIVTNTLKYGYDDSAEHQISVRVQVDPASLLVLIEDDGREFNPLKAPQPNLDLPIEEREPGGLGIHLVRKLASKIDYRRSDGLNRLWVQIAS